MEFVRKVKERMANPDDISDKMLLEARERIRNTYAFYWKITQEKDIDLTRPRGMSAQDNCNEINKVGLMLKAEIEKRNLKIN